MSICAHAGGPRGRHFETAPPSRAPALLLGLLVGVVATHYATTVCLVSPLTRQVDELRVSVSAMHRGVCRLADDSPGSAGSGSLLAAIGRQRETVDAAALTLTRLEVLSRRLTRQAARLEGLAAQSEQLDRVARLVTEQRELLGAADLALGEATELTRRLTASREATREARESAADLEAACDSLEGAAYSVVSAGVAVEDARRVCDVLVQSGPTLADALDAADRAAALGRRVVSMRSTPQVADRSSGAAPALSEADASRSKVASPEAALAEPWLPGFVVREAPVIHQGGEPARAPASWRAAQALRLEVARALAAGGSSPVAPAAGGPGAGALHVAREGDVSTSPRLAK